MPFHTRRGEWKKVVRETGGKKGVARYIYDLSDDDIHRMEFECVTQNPQPIPKAPGAFWRNIGRVIGASDGQETQFIYVEVTSGGVYHGRPVTRKQLEEMGVCL